MLLRGVARCPNLLTVEELLNRIIASERSLQAAKPASRNSEHAMRACHPWIDRVRLPAARPATQPEGPAVLRRLRRLRTALPSWRGPRFCHGAVDDVALNSACIVGKKTFAGPGPACSARSRPASWENHKRCIADPGFGRRAWVTSPKSALNRPSRVRRRANQPHVDLKGSDAMTLISTWSHFGHSNNRCSKPIGPGETRSSIILSLAMRTAKALNSGQGLRG